MARLSPFACPSLRKYVLDANGHSLFSSNVLEDVEAEFERLIATDPRMRRVLQIVEQTMTFHPRDQPEPDPGEPQTLCVLPWLSLDEPVLMGPLVFDHWSEVRDQIPEPARTSAPAMTLYRQQFVDRLAECAGADDDLSHAICQSVVPFLRANDMDEYGAVSRTSCGSSPPSSSFSGCRRSAPPVRVETLVPPRHKDVDRQMIVDLRRMLARAADVFVRPSQLGARSGPLPQG